MTTHYINEAEELCDYIYVLDKGKVIAKGTKDELKELFKESKLEDALMQIISQSRGNQNEEHSISDESRDCETAAV